MGNLLTVPLRLLIAFTLLLIASDVALGQGTTQYIYDPNGRLSAVITPGGGAAIYRYDPAGNLISIQQVSPGGYAILSFSPAVGTIGDQVTLTGVGLDTTSSVSFNGVPGQIVSISSTTLTTTVPAGATTGPITISGTRGSAASANPFTVVARVDVNPQLAQVLPNESVQFFASVVGTASQQVAWAANGVAGGNAAVGIISGNGLYVAPGINNGLTVNITATSQLDTSVIGQATVRILDPNTTSEVRTPGLLVSKGLSSVSFAGAVPVSVARSTFTNDFVTSPSVTVSKGNAFASVAHAVAVELGPLVPLGSKPVSATTGPTITSVAPATLTRGTTATVTVTGNNLSNISSILLLNSSGAPDPGITVSNISPAADGSSVTFTTMLTASATIGTDVVRVNTQNGSTSTSNLGTNVVQVQ
jgi:YD repeat-containing protein